MKRSRFDATTMAKNAEASGPLNLFSKMREDDEVSTTSGRSTAASAASGLSTAFSSASKSTIGKGQGIVTAKSLGACLACPQTRASSKTRFCTLHKRAQECIWRSSHPKSVKDGAATPDSLAYDQVFGTKSTAGIDILAAKVVNEFVSQFPDGKETKQTKKRGDFPLVQFVGSNGYRTSTESV